MQNNNIPSDPEQPPDNHEEEPLFSEDNEAESSPREERIHRPSLPNPEEVYILPLNRRPFFPGMAAPVVIEKGNYYEVLKMIAKTDHKVLGLFLTKVEEKCPKIGYF